MGWVDDLKGAVVGLDTAPLIYYIEVNPTYIAILDPFFNALDATELTVVTSFITLLEVLVQPLQGGDMSLADRYRNVLLRSAGLTSLPMTQDVAEEAARLRALHNIRTADAIQMATASKAGATFFLTNDKRLPALPHLQILALDAVLAALPQDTDSTS